MPRRSLPSAGAWTASPLAIELAAARVTMMTLPEMEAGLDDRFALLAGRPTPATAAHAPRAPSIGASSCCDEGEQHVLRSLGVFVDGFDLDAASAVADMPRAAGFAAVEALTSKSMVVRVDSERRARFGLLETVKAYAEARLAGAGETIDVRDRHLDHFHAAATTHGHTGIAELRLGVALRPDRSNLTAAFEWAATSGRWSLRWRAHHRQLSGLCLRRRRAGGPTADPTRHATPTPAGTTSSSTS